MMKKLILFIGLLFYTTTAQAATCDAGYYMSDGKCVVCTGTTYCENDVKKDCPVADTTTVRTTFPDSWYPYDGVTATYVTTGRMQIYGLINQYWGTDHTQIGTCMAMYNMTNDAGHFNVEYILYNVATGKYDGSTSIPYYTYINPGYYVTTRYADNYCEQQPTEDMLYRQAITCPKGYYCRGGYMPKCSDGPYEDEWGRTVCPAGSYCPTGASAPTPCPVGTYSDTSGASVCTACTNAPQNAHYTAGGIANDCPWECDDGYGLHDGACVPLCATGMQHLKTGNGLQFNLYPVRYSTPALHVKRNDTVCYGVLAPGAAKNAININHNGQVYHTVD